jgi:nucleoside 2-deoxyribosyltransferase
LGRAVQREITGEIERLKGEQRAYFACAMVQAIREADALLLMMPAKRGSHVEFGVAVGEGKPVVVYNANLADDICFYSLPQVELVTGDLNEAKQRVVDLLDGV